LTHRKEPPVPQTLEFMIPRAESEAFNKAVYRFLELRRSVVGDDEFKLTSEPFGPVHRKHLVLANALELREFTLYWAAVRRELKRPLTLRWDAAARRLEPLESDRAAPAG
jgi:hypothetical protein